MVEESCVPVMRVGLNLCNGEGWEVVSNTDELQPHHIK